ncbi:unnamed protein product, partial [Laminaria digitata]
KPCHGCLVSKSQLGDELGDGDFDVVRHRRTPNQIEHGLRLLAEEPNLAKREALSTKIGGVFTFSDNPFRKHLHLNLVRQVATDVFHQDSLNSWKRLLGFFLGGLSKAGRSAVASVVRDLALRLPGSEPFRDLLTDGGWASQRGMDIWRLAGVALLLLRPLLAFSAAFERFMKLGFVKGIKARLKTSRTDVAVAQCRKLIRAASTVTSILRSRAFSDPMLDILEATVREKVRTLRLVGQGNGGVLGIIHAGLHARGNIEDIGEQSYSCEALHKSAKSHSETASGRDNLRHIARRENASSAVRFMMDGGSWSARRWNRTTQTWDYERITAGEGCRAVLRYLSEPTLRIFGMGRSRGTEEWKFRGAAVGKADVPGEHWQRAIVGILQKTDLKELYTRWFSCYR